MIDFFLFEEEDDDDESAGGNSFDELKPRFDSSHQKIRIGMMRRRMGWEEGEDHKDQFTVCFRLKDNQIRLSYILSQISYFQKR